ASKNLLKPSSGDPIVGPSKDMVMGVYYLTVMDGRRKPRVAVNGNGANGANGNGAGPQLPTFATMDEAQYAYDMGIITLREPIRVWFTHKYDQVPVDQLLIGSELMAARGEGAGISERVLEALQAHGVTSVGELMDLYALGE